MRRSRPTDGFKEAYRSLGFELSGNGHNETVTVTPNSDGSGNGPGEGRPQLSSKPFSEMESPGPLEYIVEGLVPEGFPTLFYGDGGNGKSLLVLSMALAVARGASKWLGREIKKAPTMLLDFELDACEQYRRVARLAAGDAVPGEYTTPPDALRYMCAVGVRAREAFAAALAECKEHKVKLLIVDSIGPALEGDAEASRDVIGFYRACIEPLLSEGVTVVAIDHQSKLQAGERYQSKRAFGSVYKQNLSRSVIQLQAESRENALALTVRQNKHNFGPRIEPFGAKLVFEEDKILVSHEPLDDSALAAEETLTARERVLKAVTALGKGAAADVAEWTGLALGTVKKEFSRLRKEGVLEDTGEVGEHGARIVTVTLTRKGNGNGEDTGHFARAVEALKRGNGPRKALEDLRAGHGDLKQLAKSILHYLGEPTDSWEAWLPAVVAALDVVEGES